MAVSVFFLRLPLEPSRADQAHACIDFTLSSDKLWAKKKAPYRGVKTHLDGYEFYTLCPPFFSQIIMSIIIDIKRGYVHNYKHYHIGTKG